MKTISCHSLEPGYANTSLIMLCLQALSAVTVSRRAFTGLTAGPSRRPSVKVAASAEVPPNVQEARAWIAAWRAKQVRMAPAEVASQAPVSAPAHTNGKSKNNKEPKAAATASQAAPAAPTPSAKPNNKYGPSRSFDDGTLVFTADQLTSVKYSDVELRK